MEKKIDVDVITTHNEDAIDDVAKQNLVQRDYSGAIISVDPIEKRLVKKLDMRIMVRDAHFAQFCHVVNQADEY